MSKTTNEYDSLCSTIKGREKLVQRIIDLANANGATVELHEFNGPRELGLELCFGEYRCMMHFDGSEKIGAFLGHWHTELGSHAKYPRDFASHIEGSLNEFHFGKATTCEYTLAKFVRSLENGLKRTAAYTAALAAA